MVQIIIEESQLPEITVLSSGPNAILAYSLTINVVIIRKYLQLSIITNIKTL